jgi:hypothetical protein
MKNTLLLLLLFFISNVSFGQKKLFDTLKIDKTTKIIGRNPHYDKRNTYEKYNFIIEDSTKIVEFISTLKLGDEVLNSLENLNFKLTVIKNQKEIGSWTINPNLKSAMTHDGKTYMIDTNHIFGLHEIFPFNHRYEIINFKNESEYTSFLNEQKKDINFLFDYKPQFMYEGSFEIEFTRSAKYPNPREILNYIEPFIERIVEKGDYSAIYILSEKNQKNRDQLTITIKGPRKLYNKLKIDKLINKNWKFTEEKGYFFYKE